nr:hypothetical protein [uncultured Chitinophaga sp.]
MTMQHTPIGPLREDDIQPDEVINHQQEPVPQRGNQDEQSRSTDASEDMLNEEEDDLEIDELMEEEDRRDAAAEEAEKQQEQEEEEEKEITDEATQLKLY